MREENNIPTLLSLCSPSLTLWSHSSSSSSSSSCSLTLPHQLVFSSTYLTRMTQHEDELCDLGVCSGWTVHEFLFPNGWLATPIGGHGDVWIGSWLCWQFETDLKILYFQIRFVSRENVEHSFCSTFRFSNFIHFID